MREIKFRAWGAKEKMFSDSCAVFSDGSWDLTYIVEDERQLEAEETRCPCEGDAVMQYTGLKDKNGKEIYEGDIVLSEGRKVVIEWGIYNSHSYGHGDCESETYIGFNLGYYGIKENHFKECEVIGNIYENPEIVK